MVGGLAGVSPVSIMPYNWYSMLMIVAGCLSIIFQIPKVKDILDIKSSSFSETETEQISELDSME